MGLGMPYVQFDVPTGTTDGIARFYKEIFAAPSRAADWDDAPAAIIQAGLHQELVFRETDAPLAAFDNHHIQVYVTDFSSPYDRLKERDLISEESNQYQYRFVMIVDPASGAELFEIDHEVRSITHPLWGRPFVNRNPDSTNRTFAAGHEHRSWSVPWTA